jgi:hypothetical protein
MPENDQISVDDQSLSFRQYVGTSLPDGTVDFLSQSWLGYFGHASPTTAYIQECA